MENIDLIKDRAWIEVNLNNLEDNINEIKKFLSEETKIMAVVKDKCLWSRIDNNSKEIIGYWYYRFCRSNIGGSHRITRKQY